MCLSSRFFTGLLSADDPRWNEVLEKARHDIFHLPGYLKACTVTKLGEPLAFLIDTGSCGMLVPLIRRELDSFGAAYRGFSDVSSPYGYPGPITWGEPGPESLRGMFNFLEAGLRQTGVVSMFLRLHPFLGASGEMLTTLDAMGDLRPQGPVVYIDLLDPAGGWDGINPGNRRAINSILKKGCSFSFDRWETLDLVLEAYEETMQRHGADDQYHFPREFFLLLRQGTSPHLHLATSYDCRGSVTGGVFFSEVDGLIQYFLSGAFDAFASLSPSKLLINAIRLWGLERGCHTLNLGGGLGARQDSLFTFKIRLSKCTTTSHTFRKVLLPGLYRELTAGMEDDGDYFPSYRRPLNPPSYASSLAGQAEAKPIR
jgi:hypothetical protein